MPGDKPYVLSLILGSDFNNNSGFCPAGGFISSSAKICFISQYFKNVWNLQPQNYALLCIVEDHDKNENLYNVPIDSHVKWGKCHMSIKLVISGCAYSWFSSKSSLFIIFFCRRCKNNLKTAEKQSLQPVSSYSPSTSTTVLPLTLCSRIENARRKSFI